MIPLNSPIFSSKAYHGFPLPHFSSAKVNSYYFLPVPLNLVILILTLITSSCSSQRSSDSVTQDGYHLIFDGKTLDGWKYDPVYWRIENGILIGEVTPSTLLKRNSFIIKKDFITRDFDLKVEYRVSSLGNSGINYRSELIDSLPFAMRGYQADIDGQNSYTGQNYEERRRTTLAYRGQKVIINAPEGSTPLKDNIKNNAWTKTTVTGLLGSADSLKSQIRNEDWNEYHLIVKGNRLLHYINGVLMSDVTDNDTANRKFSGSLGVQVHVGPPMKIEYRNFRIKEL
jgi:hypothetical protein